MIKIPAPAVDRGIVTSLQPHPLMAVLAAGVPLTLLVDLADADGPDSARIFRREVADLSWLSGLGFAGLPGLAADGDGEAPGASAAV